MIKVEQIRYDSRARKFDGELFIEDSVPIVCKDAYDYFRQIVRIRTVASLLKCVVGWASSENVFLHHIIRYLL